MLASFMNGCAILTLPGGSRETEEARKAWSTPSFGDARGNYAASVARSPLAFCLFFGQRDVWIKFLHCIIARILLFCPSNVAQGVYTRKDFFLRRHASFDLIGKARPLFPLPSRRISHLTQCFDRNLTQKALIRLRLPHRGG